MTEYSCAHDFPLESRQGFSQSLRARCPRETLNGNGNDIEHRTSEIVHHAESDWKSMDS